VIDHHIDVFALAESTINVKIKRAYASLKISCRARAHKGVDGECLSRIELPMISGGIAVLNGSQKGKFHGQITAESQIQGNAYQVSGLVVGA
jgi:hypothetical protein